MSCDIKERRRPIGNKFLEGDQKGEINWGVRKGISIYHYWVENFRILRVQGTLTGGRWSQTEGKRGGLIPLWRERGVCEVGVCSRFEC